MEAYKISFGLLEVLNALQSISGEEEDSGRVRKSIFEYICNKLNENVGDSTVVEDYGQLIKELLIDPLFPKKLFDSSIKIKAYADSPLNLRQSREYFLNNILIKLMDRVDRDVINNKTKMFELSCKKACLESFYGILLEVGSDGGDNEKITNVDQFLRKLGLGNLHKNALENLDIEKLVKMLNIQIHLDNLKNIDLTDLNGTSEKIYKFLTSIVDSELGKDIEQLFWFVSWYIKDASKIIPSTSTDLEKIFDSFFKEIQTIYEKLKQNATIETGDEQDNYELALRNIIKVLNHFVQTKSNSTTDESSILQRLIKLLETKQEALNKMEVNDTGSNN
jgi:hypothetical protein